MTTGALRQVTESGTATVPLARQPRRRSMLAANGRGPRSGGAGQDVTAMNTVPNLTDHHAQLRALYLSLLTRQEHFDEFKQLLALYQVEPGCVDAEPAEAAEVRERLNARIRHWIGGRFDGLSAAQVLQWRAIVVEERFNVSLSPWKESNMY
jgi:hypothetical protein